MKMVGDKIFLRTVIRHTTQKSIKCFVRQFLKLYRLGSGLVKADVTLIVLFEYSHFAKIC